MNSHNLMDGTSLRKNEELKEGLSVVIVTYKVGRLLLECLDSLWAQKQPNLEIIVVDNGGNEEILPELKKLPIKYIDSGSNVGLCIGRNLGLAVASYKYIFFLDDDAVADRNLISTCYETFKDPQVVGFRGRAQPKKETVFNYLPNHYDLGEESFPHHINLEGASGFRTAELRAVGGWDEKTPNGMGHEGTELTCRLVHAYGPLCVIYQPKAVIYHDYAYDLRKVIRKRIRHSPNTGYLQQLRPESSKIVSGYNYIAVRKRPFPREPDTFLERAKLAAINKTLKWAEGPRAKKILKQIL